MRQPTPITGKSINFGYAPSGTVLGGPALGKNDRGYSSTVQDPESLRARNQSWIDQAATGIGGGAYKGIMTSLELIGYLGDLGNNLKRIADLEQIESNWLSDWAAERKKEFDEAYPIYRERSDKIFDLNDPGFYWQGIQSIVDSAVGFGVVGGGAKLALTAAARAIRLSSLLGAGLTEAGVTGSAAYISNYAESKMMGLELYNNIMDGYEDRILSGEISEAEARRIAGEEANKFMLRNKLFIITDALALHGVFRGGKFVDNLEEGVKTQYKRQAGKTVSWAERNPTLSMLGRDSIGEYFEETGQGILQGEGEYGAAKAMGEDLQDFGDSFFERALDTFVSPETQLEGVLGFFGGSAQAALGKLPSRIANKADNQARKDLQMQVISENEKGLTELFGNIAKKTEDRQRAITNNQDILANSIKEEIFNETALNNFEAGTTSILENQLKDIQSMSQEEAASLGYEDNYREEATNRLNQLESLRRDYIKIRDRFTEPEFQPKVREIFLTKVQKDNLAKDIMTVRDAIENTKSQLEGKIAQVYELSNNAMQVRVPVLEERIKVLNELEAELTAKKEQESLTPTGRKSKNKRLINKINKAYEAPLERLRRDRKKAEEEKNEIINQNKELESYYEDVILSDFAEFQDVIELQKLEADVRSAYDVVTDRYRKLSDKKELSKLIEEERGERDEILKEVQKEENDRRKASVKKENDEKAINDIQRKKEKEQARKEEEKRKKEENKRGLTSQGPVTQPPISQPPVEQTPPTENPMLDNQQYPDFLEGETVFSAEEFEDSPLPPTAEDTRQEIEERSGSNQEHATEVYPGPQEWTGRTEEVLMETLREDTERDKIVDAASALAYLTKAFEEGRGTTTNQLNANLHTLLLSPSISEGTEIEFEIDSNYITYNKLKDDPDRVPIAIKIDGTIVAYLHDIDYITPERVAEWTVIDNKRVDNIELQKAELRKIRQAIVNSPVKIKTRINRKSIGHLSRDVDNNYRDVSEALPQIEQFAIFKNGKFYATESTLTDLPLVNNLDKGQEGVVYAILPTPNGKYMAVPIKNKKIGKRVAASLTNALFIHTQHQTGETTPEHKEIRDRIINELELDIFTHAGLRDYFSLFVYKYDFQTDRDSRLDQNENLRIAKIKNDSGREQRFFNISGNSVQFIRSGAKFFEIALKPSGSQDAVLRQLQNQERLLNYLEAHLEDMHVNIDLNRMGTTTALNIPIIGTDSEGNFTVDIDSYGNYIGFLKAQTETNIVANELENGEHAYFDQPNIHFDTSFAERSSIELIPPTTSAKEGELIQPEETESTPDVPEGNPFEEFGIPIIPDTNVDESIGNTEENKLDQIKELFESNPELANTVYGVLGFGQESDLKPVSKEIPFNYGNNKELVLNGDKTITSRNFKFIPNLQAGESGLQVIDGIPFKITYHGELKHSEVKDKVGIDYSEGEAFAKTTKGKPTEKATEDFIKGVGTKHIYQLQRINNQPTPQQKQQAQQLYSQYLDTIFPESEVKDIVYHGNKKNLKLDEFDKSKIGSATDLGWYGKGFYFYFNSNSASHYGRVNAAIVNVKNPYIFDTIKSWDINSDELPKISDGVIAKTDISSEYNTNEELENISKKAEIIGFLTRDNEGGHPIVKLPKEQEELVVFEPEQIHILGSKRDIEGFEKFINTPSPERKKEAISSDNTPGLQDILIPGFTAYRQNQAVNVIARALLNQVRDKEKGMTFGEAFDNMERAFEKHKGNPNYKELLDNWPTFKNLAYQKLSTLGIVKITRDNDIEAEGFEDMDNDWERTNFDDSWSFSVSSKKNASQRIKEFLAFIPDRDENGIKASYLNTPIYKSYDEVTEKLMGLLTDTPNNFEAMREVLEDNKGQFPWIKSLLSEFDKYPGDKERLKRDFVVTFSKAATQMQMVLWEEKTETVFDPFTMSRRTVVDKDGKPKKYFTIRTINSDQDSIASLITSRWGENLRNSDLVKEVEGDLVMDEESRLELIKEFEEVGKSPDIDKVDNLLKKLGIELSPATLKKLEDGKLGRMSLKNHFSKQSGIFLLMKNRLKGIDAVSSEEDQDLYKYNPLLNNSGIRILAREEANNAASTYSSSYKNINGDTVQGFTLNRGINHIYRKLMNPEYAKSLYQIGFNSNSEIDGNPLYKNWIWRLAHDEKFRNNFSIAPFDGLRRANSTQDGVQLGNMSSKDLEVTSFGLFQNQGGGRDNIARFLLTIPGKTTSFVVTAPKHDVKVFFDGDAPIEETEIGRSTMDALYSIAESEMRRIYRFQNMAAEQRKELPESYRSNANKFFLFPELNSLEGIWQDDILLVESFDTGEGVTVKQRIEKAIRDIVIREVNEKKATWEKAGILDGENLKFLDKGYDDTITKKAGKRKIDYAAFDLIINEMLARTGMHQAFIGDPASYAKKTPEATFDNIAKRLARLSAPGLDMAEDASNSVFYSIFINDHEVPSKNIEQIKQRLKDKGVAYENINTSDASEFTTLKERLIMEYGYGKIPTDIYNSIMDKIEKDEGRGEYTLTKEELQTVLDSDKPVYSERILRPDLDMVHDVYIKSASFPLIPELTKGLEIDKLRVEMERIERDKKSSVRVAVRSAVKVGGTSFADVFNPDGSIKEDLNLEPFAVPLPRSGIRIQQELPYDESKLESTRGTQETKLLFEGILDIPGMADLKKKYDSTFKKLFEKGLEKLEQDLLDDTGYLNLRRLKQMLLNEAIERNYSYNDIAYLSTIGEDFTIPLWLGASANKYESLLLSLVTNRVIKQKTRGKSYVLVTEAGFKGNSSGIVYTDSYNSETGLLPQRIEIEDGKEVVKPAQILVPWDFRDNNGRMLPMDRFVTDGKIDFSKFPKELLESFGYRIPTQKQASMGYTEIVGFIPPIYHNTVIATADWVAQMGSDFDIDKLYTYAYNTYVDKNGNISKLTEDSLKEITEELESYQKKFKDAGVDNDNLNQALDSLEEAIIQKQSDLAQYRDVLKEEGLKYDERKRLIEDAKINIDLFKNNISDLHRWIELRELLERADVEILQNEILDVHKAVVSTPEVHDRMMQPLDFGKLERPDGTGLALDIVSAYQKREGKRNVNFLNSNYWNQKYLESIDGKAGTAIKALDSTFNAVVQQINKEDELYLRTVDMEGREHPIYIVFGKDSDYSPIKLNNLSNPLTWRGGEKSNVHAAYASAAVDNESNPILGKINSNSITFNVERAMAQVGFEEDHIAYFTSQPAIREYTEALRALEGSTAEFESNAKENAFIKIESRLLESLRNKLSKEEFEKFLEEKDNHNYPLTIKDMKGSIASPSYKGKYLHYEQIQIYALHKFLHIDNIGRAIGDVQRAINSDSKGVGKNFFESVDKEEQVKRLYSNGLIANTDKLIGTYNGEDITPSTISGFASVYGVMAANRLYNRSGSKPLFPYADKAISDTFEEIGETTGRILTPDKKREILNSMKGFLFSKSSFNVGLSEERERLFFDREGNKSVASRVLEYYGTEEGRNNAFVIRLNTTIDKTGKKPSLLQYTAAKEENIEELEIYQGFIDLMNSYPELGVDLIKYAFLSGGVQGPRNYIKYIPVQYLIENGFADAARELNMNDETILGSLSDREPGKIGSFTLQYFQHNPIEAKKIKDDLSDITLRRGKRHNILQFETDPIGGKSDNLLVDREVNGEMIRWFPEVVSQYNPTAVKKFNLFKLTGTTPQGGAIYTKIDTLGSDFYNEYNGEIGPDGIQKSLIRGNNSNIEIQSNKIPETIKTQNKPITNNSITERFTSLEDSLGTIAESNNPAYASIAKFLLSIKDTWKDTTFSIDETYRSEGAFFTDGEKRHITINPTRFMEGSYSLQGFERTVLHEAIHAVTSWAAKNRESEILTPKQRKALANIQNIRDRVLSEIENGNLENRGYYWSELQEFNSLYQDFKDGKTLSLKQKNRMSELKKYYAFSSQRESDNLHEFITEGLTSAETQELLNSIERTSSTSLLDRFVEMVKDIIQEFGKLFGNSFNENSEMANLIENFIILTDTNLNREDAVPNQASQKKGRGFVKGNRPPEGFVPDQSIGYIDQYRQEKEIEAGFRHESGETKRYLKWEKAREAAIKYNKENRGSDLTAKLTKVLGEKGDNRVYHAVTLEPKSVDYSIGRMDRKYVTLIDSIRDRISDINRSISRANEAGNGLRVKELEAQRTSLEKRIESIEDEAILATVFDIAEKELQEVRDILDQVSLSPNDLEYANKTINLWERADNIFATEMELEEGGVNIDLLGEIKGRAGTLRSRWNTIAKNNLLSEMRKLDMKAEMSDLEATTDISGFTSSFLDISRSGKAVLSAIDLWKRRASFDTNKEATEKIDQIEELTKEVRKTKDFKREGYYVFAQKTKDGKLTGDLVGYISPEFFVERDKRRNLALDSSGRNRAKNWKAYNKWKRENTTIFDTRKLFERTDDGYVWKNNKEYINELYETVNDTDKVNQELARLREYIEQYNQELLFEKQRVQSLSHPEIELSQWIAENDPKNYLEGILDDNYTSNFISGKFIPNRGYKYSVEVPISKWRDPNYERIKKDPVLFKFYNYAIDTLNEMFSYLPPEKRRNLHYNTLPSISQSILEQYNQKGVSKAVQGLGDWFIENISSAEEGAMKIDPITQRQVPTLSVSYLNDMSPEEKSYDLGKVLKIFSLSALSYKHKSKVENNIKLAQAVIDTMKEVSLRADGETRKNKFNEDTEIERGLEKLRKQVDYAVKAFYGNRRENEGVIKGEKGKVLTSKDKARKKELEEIINDSSASREKKEEAKKELANLGRNLTLSRIINLMVQYVQVKGMGWNPLAAMINLGQGQSSNMIWANGRTDFDLQDLKRATGLLLNSSLRSISGNTFANDTTRKLEALMKNFDTLKEINESAHSRTDSSNRTAKGMAQLAPFELTRRTEFFNQGQTMVAMMLNKKITNLKGEEKSLWDAYDADGKWRTEEFGEVDPDMEFRFASRLTQVIKAVHGNYDPDSPISFKGKSLGQVLMQFRSWIPEGIANRLQGQRYDELLGREVKGRWRTYADLGPVKALKTLFKQLTYNKDAFEGMDDVDIQNMRRNLMELAQVLSLTGFYYIMKGALEGEDDEDRKFFYRFMLNQTSRLQDDLLFYASPSSFEELIRNIVPISSIYMESVAFMDAVVDHMQGDGTYPSGINAGRSKVLWTGARLFPFTGQVRRVVSIGEMVYNEM